jgi:hypothetical protein
MIPGGNILNQALSLIAAKTISWLPHTGETTGANLMVAPTYGAPVSIQASVQPVSQQLMELLGLDMNRSYVKIFTSNNVFGVQRDIASDQFQIGPDLFQGISKTAWYYIDNWVEILAVKVPS